VRIAWLAALIVACSKTEAMPPPIGDLDGAPTLPPHTGTGVPDGSTPADGGTLGAASNPRGIFVTGGLVYYTNFASGAADGSVSVVPIGGGTPTELATGLDGPWAIAVASNVVFFTLAPTTGLGGISAVSASGGTPSPIQTGVTGAFGVAVDATNVYWTNDNSLGGGGALVFFVPISGGTGKQLLDFGSDLVPTGLSIFGTDLFVPTSGTQAAVLRGSTTGGTLEALDAQTSITYADAVSDGTTVFATVDDVAPAGQIVSFPRNGGAAKIVVSNLNHPQRLALDGTHLYFTDPDGGNVWGVDVSTSNAPQLLASGLSAPLPIAVADAVYVGAADAIVRIPKL
jgi:hypothetical protein